MKTALNALFLLMFSAMLCAADVKVTPDIKSTPVAQEQDEVTKMDMLIKATENSLVRLKALKTLIVEYKKCELKAINSPSDTDNLYKLVNLAKQIQEGINDSQLQDYFSQQFLDELKRFSEIANKKNIPQAK